MMNFTKQVAVLIITLFFFFNFSVNAQYKTMIYNAYVNNEMYKWVNVIHDIEKKQPTSIDQKNELIGYYYGYIDYLIRAKQYDEADKMITEGETIINQVLKASPQNATAYAYKGSFIGFRIGMNHLKVIMLGSESTGNINKAYELEPVNIQAIVDKGNVLLHTPKIFGGDKLEALKMFIKATKLIESTRQTSQNWFYLYTLTLLAKTYERLDQPKHAKVTYEKILRIEPNFKRVKSELYPQIVTRIKP